LSTARWTFAIARGEASADGFEPELELLVPDEEDELDEDEPGEGKQDEKNMEAARRAAEVMLFNFIVFPLSK
jgi:hypothetical protein